ncbi:MAG: PorP/SprF family type IX secretion system membrane protein [Bacteroidota bacterium]
MKKILIAFLVVIHTLATAQQLPEFSMYLQNEYLLNPAIAGTKDYAPAIVSHRSQWLNFRDAPTTQIGSIHGPLNQRVGLGLSLLNHETGPTVTMSAQLSYAYRLKLTDKIKLSFGIAPTVIQHYLNKNKIKLEEQNDNTFNRISGKTLVADVNAGVYVYSDNYYVGVAVPQLMENKLRMGDALFKEHLKRHYLLHAGYDHSLNEKYVLSPSLLFKLIENGSPAQIDINVKATYNKLIWAGLSYRFSTAGYFNEAAIAFLGVSKANFSFGYSYDYSFASVGVHSNGSHELFISYRIPLKKENTESRM